MSTKTDYTYSRSPSYRRKVESPHYRMPNMSRARVRGTVNNTTGDLYVSSDEEDMNYITGQRLSTRTVIEDGILLRSGNSLRNKRTVTERHNVRNRRSMQALNTNKNAREGRRSLQSIDTIDNSRESRSTTRESRSRQSQSSDYVSNTNQISMTGSSSASVTSYLSSSKSSIMQPVRKTLIQEFDDLEMEKGMKEIQNSNRKIKLYGLDQVDSDEMSGMESDVEFTGTNMSGYRSNSQYSRNSSRQSRSDTTTATTSDSSSSVVTTVTTTVVTTIIETLANTAKPVAQPVWNHVGQPIWSRVGNPVWQYLGRPVWRYLGRPICSIISRLLSTVLLLVYHLIWTYSLRYIVTGSTSVSRKMLRASRFVMVKIFIWEMGIFSRMSRRSRLCCLLLPFLLLLPLLFYAAYPVMKRSNLMEVWREKSVEDLSGIGGLSQHELREHVRRIVIQINEVKDDSLSVQEVERLVAGMVEQRLNEEKLANQNQWLEEQEAASLKAEEVEKTNITEEILRVLNQLNVRGDSLSEGDIRGIVGQVVQHEVTGLQDKITAQTEAKISGEETQEEKMLSLQNDLRTSITNLEQKLSTELDKIKSESPQDGTVQTNVSASLLQIQDELSAVRARLENLELEKMSLAGQLKNCCRNDSFYANLVQDQVNLALGQVMSGNDSAESDYPMFEAWVNSTFIKKSDFEKYMAEFSQELTDKIMKEVSRTETTEVFVSETGGQGTVSEGVVRQIVTEALEKFSADKIAMPDFALESAGGSIISTKCSETFHKNTARLSILGIPLWYVSNSPRSVIQPEMQPGSCWAFQGSKGHLVIELSANITPTAFTMEHIPKSIAPDGKIDSAPKNFIVLGLSNEYDTVGSNLGNFTYLDSGPPLQTFSVMKPKVGVYKFIQLSVLSNHGNPLYTCIYRFRVHGIPYKPKKK
nr:SUN domain-containing protein 2-like isoform X2 [Crassostrea virginica]XP_022315519.1 SUN domain-containing protein 2-like isoform X2 [Crassostrea virginica]XP_022315520.1 SUN domain-containing protein 2-like isoform X2 [Crassostrea virginica]